MSNSRYLSDILRVCSILPALVIMPAFADENIVVEDTNLEFEDVVLYYETTGDTDALGINATGKAVVNFNGALTDISVKATGTPLYEMVVFNRKSQGTVINFNSDEIFLTASGTGQNMQGARVHAAGSEVNFNGKTTINLSGNPSASMRGIDVTDDAYVLLNGDTVLNLHGGDDTPEIIGLMSSGSKGFDVSKGKKVEINATGKPWVAGLVTQYDGEFNFAEDTDVDINVSATDGVAYGIYDIYYSGGVGYVNSKGSLDVTVSGNDAYGLYAVRGGSTDIKQMDIDVTGINSAKGIYVTDYHQDEDSVGTAETTDVIIGSEGATTKIIAKGAKETIGIHVKKVEEDVELTLNGNVDVESDGFAIKTEGGAIANIGTQGASDIKISSANGVGIYSDGGATVNIGSQNTDDVEIVADNNFAVASVRPDSAIKIQGKNIDISASGFNEEKDYGYAAVYVQDGASLSIGSADTESVKLAGEFFAVQVMSAPKRNTELTSLDIRGKNIEIMNTTADKGAVHVQNGTTEEDEFDYSKFATLNIVGDNILIKNTADEGIAIAARSQGIANIVGDTTIIADSAIRVAGDANVNVNKSGADNVKMLGDMNFNYSAATSLTKIDAVVDVTLAGAESYWTGNTIVTYDKMPADDSLLNVTGATLKIQDGAVWNATVIEDKESSENGRYYTALNDLVINDGAVNIMDNKRGIAVDRIVANDAVFAGGPLTVNESIDILSGTNVFNGTVTGKGTLTLAKDATMDIGAFLVDIDTMNIQGTVIASVISNRSYGRLQSENLTFGDEAVLQLNVGSVGMYDIFGTNQKQDLIIDAGETYAATEQDDGKILIETKSIADIAQNTGLTVEAAGVVANLANSVNGNLQKLSLLTQQALNAGDTALVEKETAKLVPEEEPVARSVAMSAQSQALSLASGRMAGSVGRAGGDKSQTNGFWAQGLFNKSKFADKFHGYSRGLAIGADTTIDRKYTIGVGLTHNNSDVHSGGRNTDIDTTTVFAYGQYKPTNWFLNGTLAYTMSEYDENIDPFGVHINSVYNVNSFGAQAMTGYGFNSGITPQFGLRYLNVSQDEYNNGVNRMNAVDYEYLSGVAGFTYAFEIASRSALKIKPELRAMMTYDLVQDNAAATVFMVNTNDSYLVQGESLSRMGGEFGLGLTATYNGVDVSVVYDITLHEDYTSQTGMLKLRSRF